MNSLIVRLYLIPLSIFLSFFLATLTFLMTGRAAATAVAGAFSDEFGAPAVVKAPVIAQGGF
jgi:hypothetical protein